MTRERQDKHFIKKPIYKGGRGGMSTFIKENLRYPSKALEAGVEGRVTVRYTINHKGKVTETQVISSLGHGCDEEAQRLVKMFEFSVPKGARNVRVQFHKTIHVHFKMPKKAERQVKLQYQVTSSGNAHKNEDKRENSYGYTISIGSKDK